MKYLLSILLTLFLFVQLSAQVRIIKSKAGLFGLRDSSGQVLAKASYSMIFPFSEKLALAIKNGKYGYLNTEGDEQIDFVYDAAWDFNQGLGKVCNGCTFDFNEGEWLGGEWGFINSRGKVTIPISYQWLGDFGESELVMFKQGGKFGFIDQTANVVISAVYEQARSFREGLASVKKAGKWGFVNEKGIEVINFKYDNVGVFSEGLTGVMLAGKWGFVNKVGKEIVSPSFKEVGAFNHGVAMVKRGGKYGFVNKEGKQVIDTQFDEVWEFSADGLAKVMMGGTGNPKYGYMNSSGDMVISASYDVIGDFSNNEGIARTKVGGGFGFVAKNGKSISPTIYSDAGEFSEGRARVKKDGKWGYLDENGQMITSSSYDEAEDFVNGLARVMQNDEVFYIDLNGEKANYRINGQGTKISLNADYEDAGFYTNKRLRVKKNGKWGFVDEQGEMVIPIDFDAVSDFVDGIAQVEKGGEIYQIDLDGKMLEWEYVSFRSKTEGESTFKPKKVEKTVFKVGNSHFDWVGDLVDGLAKVEKDGKWGYVDKAGNIVVPIKYDGLEDFTNGLAKACIACQYDIGTDEFGNSYDTWVEGVWGFVNTKGEEILALEYEKIVAANEEAVTFYVDKKDAGANSWGIFDYTGKFIVEPSLGWLDFMVDNTVRVEVDGRSGVLDKNYEWLIPCEYDRLYYGMDSMFHVKKDKAWGVLSREGQPILPLIYEEVETSSEGLFPVKKDGKWGYVNKENQAVIPIIYDEAEHFVDGKARVKHNDLYFYINLKGEEVD